jgi:hypothetical protein
MDCKTNEKEVNKINSSGGNYIKQKIEPENVSVHIAGSYANRLSRELIVNLTSANFKEKNIYQVDLRGIFTSYADGITCSTEELESILYKNMDELPQDLILIVSLGRSGITAMESFFDMALKTKRNINFIYITPMENEGKRYTEAKNMVEKLKIRKIDLYNYEHFHEVNILNEPQYNGMSLKDCDHVIVEQINKIIHEILSAKTISYEVPINTPINLTEIPDTSQMHEEVFTSDNNRFVDVILEPEKEDLETPTDNKTINIEIESEGTTHDGCTQPINNQCVVNENAESINEVCIDIVENEQKDLEPLKNFNRI